ncbi:hemolysin III family protein [Leptospira sp. 2 VSF19]|uniref:Hemolysin III family protein n=1 Tax=Leptospira soteropolitanensis TaxID=2950025 RepID=A0AAW5VQK1_9LEPT|nr:hemolysin III family protein [Leptospira soteropolitanensis]MCW7493598.1 hemolysin III family protein [Leptospira soteropolitanensis]MCW7501197.1 hemolysin III family protein [Leptospira soteropolitanensis]MCW7523617.1 hemolysin III family protein [Leptospira soteropolitanensis]MCW7527310.1 hemolysin III family protein [Leptospira soteropolitanensis]MCW7531167.1 hemolysin III family protein [Leptospira soteropolitanensis]
MKAKKSNTKTKKKPILSKRSTNKQTIPSKSKTTSKKTSSVTESEPLKQMYQSTTELIDTIHEYSIGHEIANAVTHGIGGGLSIAGLSLLLTVAVLYGDVWHIVSSAIYGATLILLYLASTLYHGIYHSATKRIFKVIDHASIYLLIAGTYTPFTLVSLREHSQWGWTLFLVVWILAFAGVLLLLLFPGKYSGARVVVYILMGWLAIFVVKDIRQAIGVGGISWLVAGGLSYTIGVIFYLWDRLPFNHAIWHLFVLSGSLCHFFAILFYVLPPIRN